MNEQGLALETGPPTDLHAGAIVLDTQHLDQVVRRMISGGD